MLINVNHPNARLFVKDSCDLKDHLNLVSYQQSLAAKFLHLALLVRLSCTILMKL